MVDAFAEPTGGNLVNSVRIDEVRAALLLCTPSMDPDADVIYDVYAAARQLDAHDEQFLRDRGTSADFWSLAEDSLPADALDLLERKVDEGYLLPLLA